MDRALKERIIGAVVLVAFAVLIVPVFLDGPSGDSEIITESVSLPGQNDQTRKSQTIVLERDRTEPVPTSSNSGGTDDKPAATAVKKQPVTATKPTAVASMPRQEPPGDIKLAADTSPTGMWAVQLGSFSNQANADRLAADLRKQGYAAFLSKLETGSGALHRVRIGPQKNRDGAEAVAAKLNSAGHKGQVVTHP
jgi:DedD protein